jgi:hypothetical protein
MSDNLNKVEPHGCIVCGKVYNLLVVYTPSGSLVGCTVNTPDARPVPDDLRPLVACNSHSWEQVQNAVARHYPGQKQPEDRED